MTIGLAVSLMLSVADTPSPLPVFSQGRDPPYLNAADLDLVNYVSWAYTYASYQFECQGLSPKRAERRAEQALGNDYLSRLQAVSAKLSVKYGAAAVEQAEIHVTPGYKLTSKMCERFEKLVPNALDRLRELERRTEDNR